MTEPTDSLPVMSDLHDLGLGNASWGVVADRMDDVTIGLISVGHTGLVSIVAPRYGILRAERSGEQWWERILPLAEVKFIDSWSIAETYDDDDDDGIVAKFEDDYPDESPIDRDTFVARVTADLAAITADRKVRARAAFIASSREYSERIAATNEFDLS